MLEAGARAGVAAGIAGPAAFIGAWIASSLRQTGYPAAEIQLSGLAAPDARDPWIVTIPLAAIAAVATRLLRSQFRTPARSGWP
jgi:hypothetical protein